MKKRPSSYPMFHNAPAKNFGYAAKNRHKSTPAESMLWEALKNKQLDGYKFRRQHPADRFILDFYCPIKKLSVEVDGEYHFQPDQQEYDDQRTARLTELGITVIRFRNEEVLNDLADVLIRITEALDRL